MADSKTRPTAASVADFIRAVPDAAKRADAEALVGLMRRVTGEEPCLWGPSIIGFGRYRYVYDSGRAGEAPLTGFSPRKAATVLYVMTGFGGAEPLLDRLGRHSLGKSCLYVKRLADLDMAVLEALVTRSVAAMRARYPG